MGAQDRDQVIIDARWFITKDGPEPPLVDIGTPAEIYRIADAGVRYVVGYDVSLHGPVLVLDLYASVVHDRPPFVQPHWVEGFADIDHALAALTITFTHDVQAVRKQRRWQMTLTEITKEDEQSIAEKRFDDFAQHVPEGDGQHSRWPHRKR